jgi:arylsulfatase A-like enzyme
MNAPPLLIVGLVALVLAAPAPAGQGQRDRRPNIVLIVGDDHGYPYSGFMGDEIVETPNLDRLAEEGVTFTHAFSSASVCRPAIQTLLTGLHERSWFSQRNRVAYAIGEPIPIRAEVEHYVTLPRQLARQGYRSFQGGKHWEGTFATAGFDEGTATFLPANPFITVGWLSFGRLTLSPMYEFLDGIEEDQRFFLFLSPMLPHTPHDPSDELLARYQSKGLSTAAAHYYANITRLDEVIGDIVIALEERGLRDDSLIVYISDNGWEQAPDQPQPHALGEALGSDRGKLSPHDLGFRTPLIFNWPDELPENEVLDDLVSFEDLYATLLHYAGAPAPPDRGGISLVPRIEGRAGPARTHLIGVQDVLRARESEWVPPKLTKVETAGFLRTERWRYIEWLHRGEQALYRIEEDPLERNDVSASHPRLIERFAARAAAWRADLAQTAAWMDLMGRLTAEDGMPASGLRLWLAGADDSIEQAPMAVFSDDRGFFRFPNVPAGEYTLIYEKEAPVVIGRRNPVPQAPVMDQMKVDLAGYQTGPFLSISIPGEAPSAPEGGGGAGTIEIELLAHGRTETSGIPLHLEGRTQRGLVELRVLSGPDGFVAVDQIPAGSYRVRVSAHHGARSRIHRVKLEPGANERLKIRLRGSTP